AVLGVATAADEAVALQPLHDMRERGPLDREATLQLGLREAVLVAEVAEHGPLHTREAIPLQPVVEAVAHAPVQPADHGGRCAVKFQTWLRLGACGHLHTIS